MSEPSRIDQLRQRVEDDPGSVAFAALAEEYRRAGRLEEAIATCRTGLERHPSYVSARVTLARALVELERLDDAAGEFEQVLTLAAENLAAIRGLAEIHHRSGRRDEALERYRQALAFARHDPELQRTIAELERAQAPPASVEDGLTFEQAREAILGHAGREAPGVLRRALPELERLLGAVPAEKGRRAARR